MNESSTGISALPTDDFNAQLIAFGRIRLADRNFLEMFWYPHSPFEGTKVDTSRPRWLFPVGVEATAVLIEGVSSIERRPGILIGRRLLWQVYTQYFPAYTAKANMV